MPREGQDLGCSPVPCSSGVRPMHVPAPRTERVTRNRLGRDFVVGDVRGCFRTLEQCLATVRIEPVKWVTVLVNEGGRSVAVTTTK